MKQAFIRLDGPVQYTCPRRDFAFHTGIYGRGLTHGSDKLKGDALKRAIESARDNFFARTDGWTSLQGSRIGRLHTKSPPFGGFHGADSEHCLSVHHHFVNRAQKQQSEQEPG